MALISFRHGFPPKQNKQPTRADVKMRRPTEGDDSGDRVVPETGLWRYVIGWRSYNFPSSFSPSRPLEAFECLSLRRPKKRLRNFEQISATTSTGITS